MIFKPTGAGEEPSLEHRTVLAMAVPVMLSNVSTPAAALDSPKRLVRSVSVREARLQLERSAP